MPRKYTIKDKEAYRKTRLAGLERIRELGKGSMGGNKKGTKHVDNISAGERRTSLFVLASSCDTICACARGRGIPTIEFVKEWADGLKRKKEFRHLFKA